MPSNECHECGGKGWKSVFIDEVQYADPCVCAKRRERDAFLGDIARFAVVRESPLYRPEENGGDRTAHDLFIPATWEQAAGHFRWALWQKKRAQRSFTYLVSSDARLLTVWLGDEGYKRRPKGAEETVGGTPVENLIQLCERPALLILHLGVKSAKNVCLPDVVQESLQIRLACGRPTWVLQGDRPLQWGHLAYSVSLQKLLNSHFETVELSEAEVPSQRGVSVAPPPDTTRLFAVSVGELVDSHTSNTHRVSARFPRKPRGNGPVGL